LLNQRLAFTIRLFAACKITTCCENHKEKRQVLGWGGRNHCAMGSKEHRTETFARPNTMLIQSDIQEDNLFDLGQKAHVL